jgi:ferredoxin-NADP reductase
LDGLAPVPPVEQRAPGQWQIGTVAAIKPETPHVKSFRIELPMWMPHLPGQHYDVRLTAPDGYHAQRSYSIASSPLDESEIELTIDRLADGEVSPYFHDVVVEGDQVEVRGPFTSYFVWRGEAPVLLLGGGSGVVP